MVDEGSGGAKDDTDVVQGNRCQRERVFKELSVVRWGVDGDIASDIIFLPAPPSQRVREDFGQFLHMSTRLTHPAPKG